MKRVNRPITGKGMESFARKVASRKLPEPKQRRAIQSYIQNSFDPTQRLLIAEALRKKPRIVFLVESRALRNRVSGLNAFEELNRSLDSILARMPLLRARFHRTEDQSVELAFNRALDKIEGKLTKFDWAFQAHWNSYRKLSQ